MPKKKKTKKTGPAGGPKPKKKKKGIADLMKGKAQQMPSVTPFRKPKPKLEEPKLLPERKVLKGEKPNMLDVAGGAKTVNVKGGGLMEATKRLKAQGLKKGGVAEKKVSKVMKEFKKKKLNIGKSKKKVTNRKQALAIALNQAGITKKRKK